MRGTVLVVEDADDLREMLLQLLHPEGFDPIPVRHGGEALSLLCNAKRLPRAIIADLMMPIVNGWEMCQQLRADPKLSKIPVIVLSAVADQYRECDVVAVI